MFLLRLLTTLLQLPLRRLAELFGFGAGQAAEPPRPAPARPTRERPAEAPESAERQAPESHERRVPESAERQPPGGTTSPGARPPAPPARRPAPAPATPVAPPPSSRLKEVDEEPVLTAEYAEEGAEDGAGAEVHVAEPWPGYRRMRVPEVTSRLATASTAELAAVQLYEATHRKRRSVLAAVEARRRG